jgi:choline dehydrogenase-like flavoprotein
MSKIDDLNRLTKNYAVEEPSAEIECDVVIVGSGAGGGIAAEILTRAGLSVYVIEEGPLRTATDFKMNEKQAYADLYQEVAGRQTKDKAIQILQGRAVGGSTTVNWTSSFRTPNQTLDFWQSNFGINGLTTNEITPWFEWAENRLRISPWPIPPNKNNQLLADGAEQLGWKHAVIPRNVHGCANLGYCGMGCPLNAKQSMLVTTLPSAIKLGAQLISRARVESLIVSKGQVKGVWLSSMNQQGQVKQKNITKIRAKHVVLSAGAIGSPAVLLRSKAIDPYSNLGARTFLHPVTASVAKMAAKVEAFAGAPQSIYSDQFLWRDGVTGELGYKIEVPPMHPVLASTLLLKHSKEHRLLMQDFPYYQANLALLRDGFSADSQGGQVQLDKFGYPLLDYHISFSLWRGMRAAMLSMAELQFAAGAKQVMPLHMDAQMESSWSAAKTSIKQLTAKELRWQIMSAHVMGGCGMGEDEKQSVVDSKGAHHQLENLTVIDGSIFPTSLGVNPQLTIYSIAAKLASQLATSLNGELPSDLLV